MTLNLDHFDKKILTILQQDAGQTVSELAAKIGLSTSPCWRRLKRLMDAGVLKKRVAILDTTNWAWMSSYLRKSNLRRTVMKRCRIFKKP